MRFVGVLHILKFKSDYNCRASIKFYLKYFSMTGLYLTICMKRLFTVACAVLLVKFVGNAIYACLPLSIGSYAYFCSKRTQRL
jgi:hypothetical protein